MKYPAGLKSAFRNTFHGGSLFVRSLAVDGTSIGYTSDHPQSLFQHLVEHRRVDRCWDEAAIKAALEYKWSNGPVEGNVHRLKLIKRSMYGRASFHLLRLRVLATA
jgi:hypothetical protein